MNHAVVLLKTLLGLEEPIALLTIAVSLGSLVHLSRCSLGEQFATTWAGEVVDGEMMLFESFICAKEPITVVAEAMPLRPLMLPKSIRVAEATTADTRRHDRECDQSICRVL